jgi:general secretion pathway protein M
MLTKLKENPSLRKLVSQYDQLSRRDQMALRLLIAAVLVFLAYFLVWRPAVAFHEQALDEREDAAELLAWMQANQSDIRNLATQGSDSSGSSSISTGRELIATVTRSANAAGLSLQRFEPSGNDGMRIWIEDAPFNPIARWLETLSSEYGIVIDQAAIDRDDEPGQVSTRLTLKI